MLFEVVEPRSFNTFRKTVSAWAFGALLVAGIIVSSVGAVAQEDGGKSDEGPVVEEKPESEPELLAREPFCEVTLDAANDNMVLEIFPLDNIPEDPDPSDRLRIRLLDKPGQQYDVAWRHITKLRTYGQILFDEAQRLTEQKKYHAAFRYFNYLQQNHPDVPGLERAVLEYLLENANDLFEKGGYQHVLAVLEEVTQRDPDYRAAEVATRISRVADKLIAAEVEREDYRNARGMIARLEDQYGRERIEVLQRWREKLIGMATSLKQDVERRMEQKEYRVAERLSREMIRIWPELPGAGELRDEIARRYPMVFVGVAEVAEREDVTSIGNWAARRAGGLTQRTLVEFLGAGPEGGQYLCQLGDYYQSDDREQLTLRLVDINEEDDRVQVDGYEVSRRVLAMADPKSPFFDPGWVSLIKGTRVEDVFNLHILLRRPHVLPEAMLQFQLNDVDADNADVIRPSEGPYQRADSLDDDDVHFVANPRYPFQSREHPSEIVERHFGSCDEAIAALRRGNIDAVDYLFPADAARLRNDESLKVVPYALPTIHVLVPSQENPFTADQLFRRALLYAIDRQTILDRELMGNETMTGCQVISGPFPVGTRKHDPLAYAYNDQVEPRSYYPRLALVLRRLAQRNVRKIAEKRGEDVPEQIELVIGYPGNQVARVACQAISQYLRVVGIECELRELPPGASEAPMEEVDLLYKQVAMWEPIIDVRRLLAPSGAAAVGNEYVGMALRRLDAAENWREVRTRLRELHRIVHEQAAVIPLWQTVNYLACRRRLAGVDPSPLTLYQDVEQWQLVEQTAAE